MKKSKFLLSFLLLLCVFLGSCIPFLGQSFPPAHSPSLRPVSTNTIISIPTYGKTQSTSFEVKKYIDWVYPPLPEGMSSGVGMLIIPEKEKTWVIDLVIYQKVKMLWLSQKIDNGTWRVSDILILPTVTGDEDLIPNGCMKNTVYDPEILIIGRIDDISLNTRFIDNTRVVRAWRANRSVGRFEEISIDGIECYADNAIILHNQ